jgi:hypothetical protein
MRILRRGLVGIALALVTLMAIPGIAQAVTFRVHAIAAGAQGKCLDLQGGGTNIQVYPCNGTVNQSFDFVSTGTYAQYRIRVNGKCVDGWRNRGQQVVALSCDGTQEQMWIARPYNGFDAFENARYRGQCMDIRDWGRSNVVQLWDCHFTELRYAHQLWLFE